MPLSPIHLPDFGLSVFPIPKNGGTTLWSWVYFIRSNGNQPVGDIYNQKWLEDGPVQNKKLIVIRDPVDRFISGYRNFRDKRGLHLGFDEFFRSFPQLYESDSNLRHHFKPQSHCYPRVDLKNFDHIVAFECFGEARLLFEEISGLVLPDFHFQQSNFADFEVHEWQAEVIAQFYECDYDAGFGTPDAWRKNLPPE